MCNKDTLDRLLIQITDFSKELFGDKFKNVILYGSYARGDYDGESDIDVMIMVDMSSEQLKKYRWEVSCFCADLNIENNVLITSKLQSYEVFEKWKMTLPFYKNVLKDGVAYA